MKDDEGYWKRKLTPEQFRVLRERGTELPFSGKYLKHKGNGLYVCAGCGTELFRSEAKYDSGCGWPSFWSVIKENVEMRHDDSGRIEVVCKNCGGHLGHVFDDGPKPTGRRFCINSVSLDFKRD